MFWWDKGRKSIGTAHLLLFLLLEYVPRSTNPSGNPAALLFKGSASLIDANPFPPGFLWCSACVFHEEVKQTQITAVHSKYSKLPCGAVQLQSSCMNTQGKFWGNRCDTPTRTVGPNAAASTFPLPRFLMGRGCSWEPIGLLHLPPCTTGYTQAIPTT